MKQNDGSGLRAIYSGKDYREEAEQVREAIGRLKRSGGNDLLDVACGTGGHIAYLKDGFKVTGLDLSAGQLAWAADKFPQVDFRQADMVDFKLDRSFDAVV